MAKEEQEVYRRPFSRCSMFQAWVASIDWDKALERLTEDV
tara:strand:- start:381 stop:500 length:120 start_codon:yes stop_codon:yes gene_type:complete